MRSGESRRRETIENYARNNESSNKIHDGKSRQQRVYVDNSQSIKGYSARLEVIGQISLPKSILIFSLLNALIIINKSERIRLLRIIFLSDRFS